VSRHIPSFYYFSLFYSLRRCVAFALL
jgi:hypothetical protein